MRPACGLLVACLLSWAGPAHADPPDDLLRASSWCATAARIVRGLQEDALPRPYARRTLKIAVDRLQALGGAFAERHDEAGARRVERAGEALRAAADAVERQDAVGLASRIEDLDRQAESLAAKR